MNYIKILAFKLLVETYTFTKLKYLFYNLKIYLQIYVRKYLSCL